MSTSLQLIGLLVFALAAAIVWTLSSRVKRREEMALKTRSADERQKRVETLDLRTPRSPRANGPQSPLPANPRKPTGSHIIERLSPAPEELTMPVLAPDARDGIEITLSRAQDHSDALGGRRTILEGIQDPHADPSALSELVARDPILTARVLKAINSPPYELPQPVGSILRAIPLLGRVEIRNLVWRVCLGAVTEHAHQDVRQRLFDLWDHSFAVSRTAHAIAKELSLPHPEDLAAAGLLHDVGKLITLSVWPADALKIYPQIAFSHRDVLCRELDQFKLSHAQIGARMIASWDLPARIASAIEHHHHPSYVTPAEVDGETGAIAVVHLADLLCHLNNPDADVPADARTASGAEPGAASSMASRVASGAEPGKDPTRTGSGIPHQPRPYLPREGWLQALGLHDGIEQLLDRGVLDAVQHRDAA